MNKSILRFLAALFLITALVPAGFSLAQGDDIVPAEIANDEGGTVKITGTMPISNPNVKTASDTPVIILEDQGGFVQRDFEYIIPPESQVIGRFTSDFYSEDEFVTYELILPSVPQGSLHDVDNDGESDSGVQIFQVGYWDSGYGDIFVEERDGTGWSGGYSSASSSENPAMIGELNGGKLLVYAPDDQQGFPAGFGEDALLFTEDDPAVLLPQGYTIVDMDSDPFTFDRSSEPVVDLIEPESIIPDDFSEMTYTEAFDALIDKGRREYSFTESKNIDWDALSAEFRPRFEEAEANGDAGAYYFAIYDLARAIPDGHVSAASDITEAAEQELIAGGVGLAIRELTDGRILVNFVMEDGPAEAAGIEYGAEITAVNGEPIEAAIAAVESVNAPYSLAEIERLDQLRFLLRFPIDAEIELTFKNPGSTEEQTATLTAIAERESLAFTRRFVYGAGNPNQVFAPVEWEYLDSGYGYVQVNDFSGNEPLIIETWEYFLSVANALDTPGIIIDLRVNGGGYTGIAYRLASYLFDEEIEIEFSEQYSKDIGGFFYDPRFPSKIFPEVNEDLRYDGEVVVLIGPGCASACEFFAYSLTLQDRSTVVGQYSSNGIAGGYYETLMPEGVFFVLPTFRSVDAEGNIIIESIGIQPDVRVPVDEENMSSPDDVVMDGAIAYLDEATAVEVLDGGAIAIGEEISGELAENQRVRYTLDLTNGDSFSIYLEDPTGELDTYLRLYIEGVEDPVLENDDNPNGETVNSAIEELTGDRDETITLEVGTFDDAVGGAYTLRIEDLNAAAPEAEATEEATEAP